jgi:hypothetical protein
VNIPVSGSSWGRARRTTRRHDLHPGRVGQCLEPQRDLKSIVVAHRAGRYGRTTHRGGGVDEAVAFYSKLFDAQPAKLKPGYANFALAEPALKLVLLENPGNGGTLNHLGIEVESSDTVHSEIARLTGEGLFTDEEIGTTCCFATQAKVWVTGPGGERWEVYTVLADSETFGSSPKHLEIDSEDPACCGSQAADPSTAQASCC